MKKYKSLLFMRPYIILVFLVVFTSCSTKEKSNDTCSRTAFNVKVDDRLKKIIQDYAKDYPQNKVFKLSSWTEERKNPDGTSKGYYLKYGLCKVDGLYEVIDSPPLVYCTIDTRILLIKNGLDHHMVIDSTSLLGLIKLIKPFVDDDFEIISLHPLRYAVKPPPLIDDTPYGKIYIFKNDSLVETQKWLGVFPQ